MVAGMSGDPRLGLVQAWWGCPASGYAWGHPGVPLPIADGEGVMPSAASPGARLGSRSTLCPPYPTPWLPHISLTHLRARK